MSEPLGRRSSLRIVRHRFATTWPVAALGTETTAWSSRQSEGRERDHLEWNLHARRMAKKVRDVMSKEPIMLSGSTPIIEAARQMRAANVGSVIVEDGARTSGIVTDRDIVIRAVAQGRDPATTPLSEICTTMLATVSPDDKLDRAIDVMRKQSIRRVPVMDSAGKTVGIVSLGDLAIERDAKSVLGQISAAPPSE